MINKIIRIFEQIVNCYYINKEPIKESLAFFIYFATYVEESTPSDNAPPGAVAGGIMADTIAKIVARSNAVDNRPSKPPARRLTEPIIGSLNILLIIDRA